MHGLSSLHMDLVFSLLVHINYLKCSLMVLLSILPCYYFMTMNSSYVLVEVIEKLTELLAEAYVTSLRLKDVCSRKTIIALLNMWLLCEP
jgi:hypothetical protein